MIVPPTKDQLDRAAAVARARLPRTPLVAASELHERAWLKLEVLQPTGSFKVRGALAALADDESPVVTASAGNHGLGVAYAAALLGRPATVVVATDASPAKVERIRRFPVRVVERGRGYIEAENAALELAAAQGARFVSPYNDAAVIAGQRTLGLELDELAERLVGRLAVVVCVGGGGLLAGLSMWAAERGDVRLVGVEAAASTAFSAALAAGHVVEVPIGPTIADGMAGGLEAGSITVDIVSGAGVATMTTVDEDELLRAVAHLHREHGLVVEGAGAAATAAVLAGKVTVAEDETVIALVTGRNVNDDVIARALAMPRR